MEIIRKFCNEIENLEGQFHDFTINRPAGQPLTEYPAKHKVQVLSADLNDLLAELCARLGDFADILDKPSENVALID